MGHHDDDRSAEVAIRLAEDRLGSGITANSLWLCILDISLLRGEMTLEASTVGVVSAAIAYWVPTPTLAISRRCMYPDG